MTENCTATDIKIGSKVYVRKPFKDGHLYKVSTNLKDHTEWWKS